MRHISSVLLLLLGPSTILAQSTTGNLEGWVTDSTRTGVLGANVVVTSPELQGVRGMSTDERGYFRLLGLPSGRYTVKVHHISYQPAIYEDVQIWLGKTTSLPELKLRQTSVQMPEVVVSGQRPLLDPTSSTSGANLVRENFEVLPIDRNYRTIASLLPNANQSYYGDEVNIAGATGVENRYFVNGNDVTNAYRGMGGTNLPYNFIREIEVKTGGYEPEYKSSLGGIINVITYSGGNNFSGQVFGFFTNNDFAGEPRVGTTQPPNGSFAQYDFGFTLGGPILRDKLWFFTALNPSYRNEDILIPGLGYYPDRTRTMTLAEKLTWKASDALDITATLLGDPSTEQAVGKGFWAQGTVINAANPDPFLKDVTSGGYNLMVDARHLTSENLITQGSVSWTTQRLRYWPSTQRGLSEVYYVDGVTMTTSGGSAEKTDLRTSILAAKLSGTALFENHVVKAGIEYREIGLDNLIAGAVLSSYSDTLFFSSIQSQIGTIRNHVPSVFIQDAWSISKDLSVSGGLRWDGLFIVVSNGQLVTRLLRQFQPRFGFVWMPGSDESQKIFGSLGRYEEDLMFFGSSLWHIDGASQVAIQYDHDPRINPAGGQTVFDIVSQLPPGVQDLYGQYYDEVTLGFERLLAEEFKVTLKGTYRTLREVIEDAQVTPGGEWYYGNPGEGPLSAYPHPRREYAALEVALEKTWGSTFNLLASYVLSRNYGNYLGLYYQEGSAALPNAGPQFDLLSMFDENSTGLLPNDRTHIFKLNTSYRFDFGLTCAASFLWESGTPLSEYAGSQGNSAWTINLVPRGSAGRLPSLWDLNVRLAYALPFWNDAGLRPRFIVDIFHVGSQRRVVMQDQYLYGDSDAEGNLYYPNPLYGIPTKFQPPMTLRMGMEVSF